MKFADDIKYALFKDEEPDNAIDLLKFDHRHVNELFEKCLKSEDKEEREELAAQIVEALTLHTVAEEKVIYPILKEQNADMGDEAFEEHRIIKFSLAEVGKLKGDDEAFHAKVKVLSELVSHHVREEEDHMLPKVQDSGANLKDLANQIRIEKYNLQNEDRPIVVQNADEQAEIEQAEIEQPAMNMQEEAEMQKAPIAKAPARKAPAAKKAAAKDNAGSLTKARAKAKSKTKAASAEKTTKRRTTKTKSTSRKRSAA